MRNPSYQLVQAEFGGYFNLESPLKCVFVLTLLFLSAMFWVVFRIFIVLLSVMFWVVFHI